MLRMKFLLPMAAALLLGADASSVHAQDYPTKPITLIVPFPAGGGVDVIGRIVADKLAAELGQPVVIDNRGGAAGVIGTRVAARAAPDGYTLVMATSGSIAINPNLYANPGYQTLKDLTPDRSDLFDADRADGASVGAGEFARRRDRLGKARAGLAQHRHAAARHQRAAWRRASEIDGRHRRHHRHLSRHRPADDRSARRPRQARPECARSGDEHAQGRPAQGADGAGAETVEPSARRADLGGSRTAGLRVRD